MAKTKARYTKTRHRGVYYRDSETRLNRGKPDRCYTVWFADASGKGTWHRVGWASDGMTPELAVIKRAELMSTPSAAAHAAGHGCTVDDAVANYVAWGKATRRTSIVKAALHYGKHLQSLVGSLPLSSITGGMLTRFCAQLFDAGLDSQSVVHALSFCRAATYRAITDKLHDGPNPFSSKRGAAFEFPKVDNARERAWTPDEAADILERLKRSSTALHVMSLLSLRSGLRATEIFGIAGQDVSRQSGGIYVTGKTGMREFVHVDTDILDLLDQFIGGPGDLLFPVMKGPRTGQRQTRISSAFARAVAKYNKGVTNPRMRVSFHTWRHTYASWLAQSGRVTLLELKEFLRHETLEMTQRYAHLIPGGQREKNAIVSDMLRNTGHR